MLGGDAVVAALAAGFPRGCRIGALDPLGPDGAAMRGPWVAELLAEIDRVGADVVVNAVGLTWGHGPHAAVANSDLPAALASELLASGSARLLHLGSPAEYGDPGSSVPISEARAPSPDGAYGTSKWAGSRAVLDARGDGLAATVLRVFNPAGEPTDPSSPIHQFATELAALGPSGGEIELWWPDTVRDFVLWPDIGRAVGALAGLGSLPAVVNVCSGIGVRFGDIVTAMAARAGVDVVVRSSGRRPAIPAVVGDPALLRSLIGWSPHTSAETIAGHVAVGHVGALR